MASSLESTTFIATEGGLSLPRILCLHGGGLNSAIFQAQARALIRALPDFRLVFADAPYLSCAGPGIVPVYQHWGPFRRWLRWKDEHPPVEDNEASLRILRSLEASKEADPGTGPWVGVLGFSQGAKIAASLLYRQQVSSIHRQTGTFPGDSYRFGVIIAGSGPPVYLSTDTSSSPPAGLVSAGQMSTTSDLLAVGLPEIVIQTPTIHIHGLNDPGLYWHRDFLKRYFDSIQVTLVEWEGAHRMPLKSDTVKQIAADIYRLAHEQGVEV